MPARTAAQIVAGLAVAAANAAPAVEGDGGKLANARKLWEASGVPPRYSSARYLKIDPDVEGRRGESGVTYGTIIQELRSLFDSPGTAALLGGRGTGKTWMACALIREFCRDGRAALYRDAMDYFLELKSTYDDGNRQTQEQVEARYLRPSLLVLDEAHERGDTVWEDRMLTRLINKRYASELSTVLIANQTAKTFEERVGISIYDRICDGGGVLVCDWKSLRGPKEQCHGRPDEM